MSCRLWSVIEISGHVSLTLNELRQLCQLREEKRQAQAPGRGLSLDRHMLQESVRKKL
jgi:hypothetical protein